MTEDAVNSHRHSCQLLGWIARVQLLDCMGTARLSCKKLPSYLWECPSQLPHLPFPSAMKRVCVTPGQCFSVFLMPWPFSTVPHAVVTTSHKIISLLFYSCTFCFCYESQCKYLISRLSGGVATHRLRTTALQPRQDPVLSTFWPLAVLMDV